MVSELNLNEDIRHKSTEMRVFLDDAGANEGIEGQNLRNAVTKPTKTKTLTKKDAIPLFTTKYIQSQPLKLS